MPPRTSPACPLPATAGDVVELGHGSGGKLAGRLLRERFLPRFSNPYLDPLGDGAVVPVEGGEIVLTTDTFVVRPLEFPGGNIGHLAVHGTLNDVAMMGGEPRWLSAGFVLEEGLAFSVLDRILDAIADTARAAGVAIVTGDTKVVERGGADGMFINTTGVGTLRPGFRPRPDAARLGDKVLVSGPLGRHGMAVMAAREHLPFTGPLVSDTANLFPLVEALRGAVGPAVRALRDATRGGMASALNEIARASRVGVVLDEGAVPVPGAVQGACALLGLDPYYVANEGVLVAFVEDGREGHALEALRRFPEGREAAVIGRVVGDHPGMVVERTAVGGTRVVDLLPGDQLPRIC